MIDSEKAIQRAQNKIQERVRKQGANLVILDIDSAGGDKGIELAKFLAMQLKPGEVRTVAVVRGPAAGEAAMIAVACDHVYFLPDGKLGGQGRWRPAEGDARQHRPLSGV